MSPPQVATPTSVLPGRPESPIDYGLVTVPDGSVGYDGPLEDYFDAPIASPFLSSMSPARLYDTIAYAHDHRLKLSANSAKHMGISPDLPGWCPRRPSQGHQGSAVGVAPSEVNTLVPYIPPIDTSMPPPSKEWLEAKAKQLLADAHAKFEDPHPNATSDVTKPGSSQDTDDTDFFDYDTDSTLDDAPVVSRKSIPQPPQQHRVESESNTHDADSNSNTDTDTDTDTDLDSDDGYNWSTTRISESSPLALGDVPRWIIPRKRPSVVAVDDSSDVGHGTSLVRPCQSSSTILQLRGRAIQRERGKF